MNLTVSVVIPSFQQCSYLRQCLDSVCSQQFPGLQLIVVDGGSTDGSVDLIREYESRIYWWVSEPDGGQTDAINKGLRKATGDVWGYLNSDDLLEPDGLAVVARFFIENANKEWLSGGCRVFGEDIDDWFLNPAGITNEREVLTPWDRPHPYVFPQSGACFMRRSVIEKIGFFDPSYHYSMDMEYYTRAALKAGIEQCITDQCLAAWRLHPDAKSFQKGIAYAFREDEIRIAKEYLTCLDATDQRIVRQQLIVKERDVLLRKAMWNHRNGDAREARSLLWKTIMHSPLSILHRPWLGAARRILTGAATNR